MQVKRVKSLTPLQLKAMARVGSEWVPYGSVCFGIHGGTFNSLEKAGLLEGRKATLPGNGTRYELRRTAKGLALDAQVVEGAKE